MNEFSHKIKMERKKPPRSSKVDRFSSIEAELLFEIFNHLDGEDLSSLLLTCHRFNVFLSTKIKFMRHFELKLTQDRSCKRFTATRLYPNVKLQCCEGFLHVFSQIGPSVKRIEIDCEEANLNSLKKILMMCPGVEEVTIRGFQVFRGYESSDSFEMPKLRLKTLQHFCKFNMLSIFEQSQVENFEVYGYPEVEVGLRTFLSTQKELKCLKLSHFYKNSTLFFDSYLMMVNFELTELKLHSFHHFNPSHFSMFLMNHFDSLTYLEANNVNVEIFKTLCFFKGLKCIKIHNIEKEFEEMPHVEGVEIGRVLAEILGKFPRANQMKYRHSYYRSKAERLEGK